MARYNLVQIGDIYFTSDGTNGGLPCRVKVNGINDAILTKTGQTIISANGTPWTQVVNVNRRGIVFQFSLDYVDKDVHDDIIALMETLINAQGTETMNVSGDLGNYNFDVKPMLPNPVEASGEFSTGILKGVSYSFITT